MSLVYRRPGSPYWYVTRTRQSTKMANKKYAEEFAKKVLLVQWRENVLGTKVHLWSELAADWLDMKAGKSSLVQDEMVIKRFTELLERRKIETLVEVTADVVAAYGKQAKASASASTANRHLNTIRAMLRQAEDKEWIPRAPKVEQYDVQEAEANWLSPDQAASITPFLPEWVADMYVFAQQTGLRFSNVAGFKWSWIRQDGQVAFVPAVDTKTKRTYTVPLSDVAKGILDKLRIEAKSPVYVFVGLKAVKSKVRRWADPNGPIGQRQPKDMALWAGRRLPHHTPVEYVPCAPVTSVQYWWEKAVAKAGLKVTWHEATRHTWATMHTKRKTPDRILAKMGGWASTKMLSRYSHHDAEDLIEYANNLNGVPK